ncbi:MAG TPA: adenylyltransferase/cytidyltransferase family protein [Candidatus Acidoferrum sp.]|nr:adenylyltransferase/cytidyltransferase family protein [Candidatus Acidoferrum sp.]
MNPRHVVVTGAFDNLRSHHLRFLEEAARLGELTVLLWPDRVVREITGQSPVFPEAERLYFLNAVRYVNRAIAVTGLANPDELPEAGGVSPDIWADEIGPDNEKRRRFCQRHGLEYHILDAEKLQGFPVPEPLPAVPGRKKVVVTGSYDWFHSGHVRFFEEVSDYGDLYVVVGHDANIRLLKGEGHPLLPEAERRYLVGSIKFVKEALISSGDGWLDADPEIRRLKPDIYAVNEDGDRGGKREYCEQQGIQYLVLKRLPAPGLPKRSSTDLRGF